MIDIDDASHESASDASLPGSEAPVAEPERPPFHTRPVVRIVIALLAAAVILVLLGIAFSPRYWRF